MATFKVLAKPTFKHKVGLPSAGGETVQSELTFRAIPRSELVPIYELRSRIVPDGETFDMNDQLDREAQFILKLVEAWDFEEALTLENVRWLVDNVYGVADVIATEYLAALRPAKLGN